MSAVVDVFEYFNPSVESIEKPKILQVFSDGPNVNLSHLKILDDHRRDAELSPLINIGTCGLHTIHNSFKHGDESPSRRADYEGITSTSKSDFLLRFCSDRWVENDVVAKKFLSIWPKMIKVFDFWKGLRKSE